MACPTGEQECGAGIRGKAILVTEKTPPITTSANVTLNLNTDPYILHLATESPVAGATSLSTLPVTRNMVQGKEVTKPPAHYRIVPIFFECNFES